MKLKKALSGILAAAMVVSLTPAMAFATTTNTISGVSTVSKSELFTKTVEIAVKGVMTNWAGYDSGSNKYTEEITLKLDGAKWAYAANGADDGNGVLETGEETTSNKLVPEAFSAGGADIDPIEVAVTNKSGGTAAAGVSATVVYCSANSVKIEIANADKIVDSDLIQLTLSLKSGTSAGDITLSMSSNDGDITSLDSRTIATVVSGKTAATVPDAGTEDLENIAVRTNGQTASDIQIKEVTNGCLGKSQTQCFSITLPKETSWTKASPAATDVVNTVTGAKADVTFGGTLASATKAIIDPNNDKVLLVEVTTTSNTTARRTLIVTPKINTTKNVSEGDVSVTLRGIAGSDISDESGLVIAKIGNSSVSVFVDPDDFKDGEIPVLKSGLSYKPEGPINNVEKNVVITLEENNKEALTQDKFIDFTFDKAVQISGNVIVEVDGTDQSTGLDGNAAPKIDKNRNSFGWKTTGITTANKEKIKVYIPITVEAGFEGDIICTVSGEAAGIADTDVVVAAASPVVTVATEKTDVRTGVQNQPINDIVITEKEAGALKDSIDVADMPNAAAFYTGNADNTYVAQTATSQILVEFPFTLNDLPTVEVTEGDLDTDDVAWYGGAKNIISIDIKAESVKAASTITISDIKTSLNRVAAEGGYDIQVYGSAVVQNAGFGKDKEFADSYLLEDYINVITPADSTTVSEKVQAAFVIGEASYTNNGAATEMDAAPFIDSHNRTMVPIRYVANACGISENDIRWEQNTQTAIINGLNTVVTVKMGSNKLQTSTGEITMDTVAVNNNGRIYVPVRYIANALGANVSWDAATKTVTLTK